MTARAYIGTQGWYYGSWVGPFYPPGTRSADMLARYARAFETVEVDSTFYQVPADPVVERWRESVPDGFLFAVKLPQEITHEKRLEGCEDTLSRFLRRIEQLRDRIGPILIQLSPGFLPTRDNTGRLSRFANALSRDFRWVVEFRNEGWLTPSTLEFLSLNGIGLALVDGRWIPRQRVLELCDTPTAGFAYVRWMGAGRRYADYSRVQGEPIDEFEAWAGGLRRLSTKVGRIFGFANNHVQGHAPHSARVFQKMLGLRPVAPEALREQAELF